MTTHLPSEIEVRAAMDQILEHSEHTGKRPTIADVERKLGIAHATFCRHFTALTSSYFKPRVAELRKGPVNMTGTEAETIQQTMQRLRRENTDLRKLIQLYAEQIRQLTLDRHELTLQVEQLSGITRIGTTMPS
jgi:AraC-like DNA-binding protein